MELAEAHGAIPPKIHIRPVIEPELDPESASEPDNLGAKSPQGLLANSAVLL